MLGFVIPSMLISRKGTSRNAWQVLANGGVATLCAIATALDRGDLGFFAAFAGAYAAATADTWASEIGIVYGGVPRSIVTFARMPRGADGGVTFIGSAAMLAGALWIALIWSLGESSLGAFWIIASAGVAGAVIDSILGATLQQKGWMTNDAVNALATLSGAVAAGALYEALR